VSGNDRVLSVSGLSYRQLDHAVRKGYLRPQGGEGTGYPRTWPAAEVEVARIYGRLVLAGVTPAAAARVARGGALAPGIRIVLDELESAVP
jgi:hypothetical protein